MDIYVYIYTQAYIHTYTYLFFAYICKSEKPDRKQGERETPLLGTELWLYGIRLNHLATGAQLLLTFVRRPVHITPPHTHKRSPTHTHIHVHTQCFPDLNHMTAKGRTHKAPHPFHNVSLLKTPRRILVCHWPSTVDRFSTARTHTSLISCI